MLDDNQITEIVGWPTATQIEKYREVSRETTTHELSQVAKWLAATAPLVHQAFLEEFKIEE